MKLFATILTLLICNNLDAQQSILPEFDVKALFLTQYNPETKHIPWKQKELYKTVLEREHNRKNVYHFKQSVKISASYSTVQLYTRDLLSNPFFGSTLEFAPIYSEPNLSFSHEMYINNIFSLGYTLGYGKNYIYDKENQIANKNLSLFTRLKLNIFRFKHVEAYFQLNVGAVYNNLDFDRIQSIDLKEKLPANYKMYIGFTPIGLNFRLTERLWMNTELSMWSYETLSVGLKYKFQRNTFRDEMFDEIQSSRTCQ